MKKRLLIFTILLTILLTFLAIRGRVRSAKEPAVTPAPVSEPAAPPDAMDSTGQGVPPVESEGSVPEQIADTPTKELLDPAPSDMLASVAPVSIESTETVRPPVIDDAPLPAASAPALRRLVVEFDDIPCPGHIRTIIDAMARVNGVSDVTVFYDESRGEMDYDPSVARPDDVIRGMPPDCPARVIEDKPRT